MTDTTGKSTTVKHDLIARKNKDGGLLDVSSILKGRNYDYNSPEIKEGDNKMTTHPDQPLVIKDGIKRFKQNELVSYLLDQVDINNLITFHDFSVEDWAQVWQLGGRSWQFFCDDTRIPNEIKDRISHDDIPEDEADVDEKLTGIYGREEYFLEE